MQKPERGVVFEKRVDAGSVSLSEQKASEFSKAHRAGLVRVFDQTGLEAPVLDALDHVLADAEPDDRVVGEKPARVVLHEPDSFLEPSVAGDEGLMPGEPQPVRFLGWFVTKNGSPFFRGWTILFSHGGNLERHVPPGIDPVCRERAVVYPKAALVSNQISRHERHL